MTLPRREGGSAVCSLWHFPSPCGAQALPGTLPYGARTFLTLLFGEGATAPPSRKYILACAWAFVTLFEASLAACRGLVSAFSSPWARVRLPTTCGCPGARWWGRWWVALELGGAPGGASRLGGGYDSAARGGDDRILCPAGALAGAPPGFARSPFGGGHLPPGGGAFEFLGGAPRLAGRGERPFRLRPRGDFGEERGRRARRGIRRGGGRDALRPGGDDPPGRALDRA